MISITQRLYAQWQRECLALARELDAEGLPKTAQQAELRMRQTVEMLERGTSLMRAFESERCQNDSTTEGALP